LVNPFNITARAEEEDNGAVEEDDEAVVEEYDEATLELLRQENTRLRNRVTELLALLEEHSQNGNQIEEQITAPGGSRGSRTEEPITAPDGSREE
jgi:hypothetical protein